MDMRVTAAPMKTKKAVSNLLIRSTDTFDTEGPTNQNLLSNLSGYFDWCVYLRPTAAPAHRPYRGEAK